MEGDSDKVLEDASKRSGDLLQKILHWARAIPFISDDMMQKLLHRSVK